MTNEQTVYIVDDDEGVREGLCLLLDSVGLHYQAFSSAIEFLEAYSTSWTGCLVLDMRMPRMSGLDLQEKLNQRDSMLPVIFITGHGDIPMAVEAMRRGALDFIRKPFREEDLLDRVNEALALDANRRERILGRQECLDKIALLSKREREVFECVAEGQMNKVIAAELGISKRTIEVHRAQVMKKLGVRTLAELVRVKLESESSDTA